MQTPNEPTTTYRESAALHSLLARAPWAVVIGGVLVSEFVEPLAHLREKILLTCIVLFFLLLILRLVLVASVQAHRRMALVLLLMAMVSWFLGSAWINSVRVGSQAEFPAPGEWLFLVSYLGMAGYLLRDVDRPMDRPERGWLDVVIICGGTACLASLFLVTPIRVISGYEGIALLLALIYPLVNLVLALVVLGQSLMQLRSDRRKTWMIGTAFVLLMWAESGFALQDSANIYDFGNVSYALWGGGYALLAGAACRPGGPVMRRKAVPNSANTLIVVGAGLIALVDLTIKPDDTLAYYTIPPAVLTLLAIAARLALALKDANKANEAFAMSYTDELTKLSNRRAMQLRLAKDLADRTPLALMILDLDDFKEINDSFGHHAGDTVLTVVGARMREIVEPNGMVVRLGGDEFAIMVESNDEDDLMETGHEVLTKLAEPIRIDGIEISPSASIGVTVALPNDSDGGTVLRRADIAMYQAKKSGLGVALYDAGLDRFSRSDLTLVDELREGIADDQIEVWYQPQIDAATLHVSGLEALARWRHPTQGILCPTSFLPAARRAGLMTRLSEIVAQQVILDLQTRWRMPFDLRVAINCAPTELLGSTFLPYLYAALAQWKVDADRLVLEVTEDSFLSDPQHTRDVLIGLRRHGVQISIDDYGTGFSSLTYLRNLPMQELKIDRALIDNVAGDDRSGMIVFSTIQLAHALDMRIVAEGVENAADFDALKTMGIDTVQGHYFAEPMPADQCHQWIRMWNSTNGSRLFSPLANVGQEPELEGKEA